MLDELCGCIGKSLSASIGAVIGAGVSFVVNCTLLEISKSKFFSYVNFLSYFTVLFDILYNFGTL